MRENLIRVLDHLREHGGTAVIHNPAELGLMPAAFVVATNFLSREGLIEQHEAALRLTEKGVAEIDRLKPTHYEVMFSKSNLDPSKYFRVYIELNDEDRIALGGSMSDDLKTRLLVKRVGILELLPAEHDDGWHEFGRTVNHNVAAFRTSGVEPKIVKGRKVWIVGGG